VWTRGVAIDWQSLPGTATARRISLPTYAFERQRHWVDAGVPAPVQAMPVPRTSESDSAAQVAMTPPAIAFQRLPDYADWLLAHEWTASASHPDAAQ
jgi:acyl transferase domain-containing protein